jgi:Fe-S oxidoreductase
MDVGTERITFWFGCNMLRHAEMIRLSIMLLERVGYNVAAAGGPAYCCGTAHDHQPHGASNMAARTVARFNDAADNEGRGKVVTWCPSCHMHMSDIMAPGNAAAFEIAHITELLADPAERLAPLLQTEVKRRVLLHRHAGLATHVAVNDRVSGLLARIPGLQLVPGPVHPGHMCSALAAVPGALSKATRETWAAAGAGSCDTVCTIFHSCHRELAALEGKDGVRVRNWVHLVAEGMGIEASDAYLGWRTGGAPDIAAIERADEARYRALVEPELRKPSPS